MAKQKSYVAGALGVLAGVVIGVSGTHTAEIVSYSGADPNASADQPDFREENAGLRRSNRINNYNRPAEKLRVDLEDLAQARARLRLRAAAPDHGNEFDECTGLTSMRLTRCIWSVINGEPYSPNDWGM